MFREKNKTFDRSRSNEDLRMKNMYQQARYMEL